MSLLSDLSIVIPTIGRSKDINSTISFLNKGLNKPKSIILVIPKAELMNLKIKNFKNLTIIAVNKYGQVNQRNIGFKNSKTKFTLQLDDDCKIDQKSLINLKKVLLKYGKKNCVGPVFYSNQNFSLHKYKNNLSIEILCFLFGLPLGLKKMGKTNYKNLNIGIDPYFVKDEIIEVEWIPGGCKMMYTDELISYNYFKFQGKAYYEDIIHSKILRKKNIKMLISKISICKTDTVNFSYEEIPYVKNIVRQNFGKKYFRYLLWYFLVLLKKSI